ncbi:hypothetical protein ACLMJK_001129 [Lecanora helva]
MQKRQFHPEKIQCQKTVSEAEFEILRLIIWIRQDVLPKDFDPEANKAEFKDCFRIEDDDAAREKAEKFMASGYLPAETKIWEDDIETRNALNASKAANRFDESNISDQHDDSRASNAGDENKPRDQPDDSRSSDRPDRLKGITSPLYFLVL